MARATLQDRIGHMFRALSDSTRLRILSLLRGGECCVGDLVAILGTEQPSVSRHLAYLRRAGLVRARREGAWIHYSLAPASPGVHAHLLECVASAAVAVPQLRRDEARRDRLRRDGGCCPGTTEGDS